jgi:uncharacterized membrane protein YGL010W
LMGPLQNLLDDYVASHLNRTNKVLHWFCVPIIVWCVIGFLRCLPNPEVNWASLAVLAVLIYYAVSSVPLSLGALPYSSGICGQSSNSPRSVHPYSSMPAPCCLSSP